MVKINVLRPKPKGLAARAEATLRGLEAGYRQVAEQVLRDYKRTTATWDHQPKFTLRVGRDGFSLSTDDTIYGYVDKGTRPHVIRIKRAKRLRFAEGYTAKTVPGLIGSRAGGARGPIRVAIEVRHPGSKPRKFSAAIQEKWLKLAPGMVQAAIDKELR